jgi:AraC family transcriptional regulator, regulatory protein of adaptative response / DNA-3-methyladenine glycosylase II
MRQAGGVVEDFERCYLAVCSRDERFDGWFITAVTSTGVYCRPSCPARTPHRENVRFYASAAAAQHAGFRACKRCRPDATPGSPEWDVRADAVARAMRLIADGVVDRDGVPGLARHLGYSTRHLQRLLLDELGAGPVAIARAQRAQTARILIETTTLAISEVAFAAGFSSVRQFNDTVRSVFGIPPSALRARVRTARTAPEPSGAPLLLHLPFRQPLCPDNLFGHLAATAVPGIEEVRDGHYRRTVRLPHGPAVVDLMPTPDRIVCRLSLSDLRDLTTAIARCRRLLDLDADPQAVDAHLGGDPVLGPLVRKSPGRRVPRCVDGAEMAVRAVLGQHVSVAAARTATAALVARCADRCVDPDGGLTHLFPEPGAISAEATGLPEGRRRALESLSAAIVEGRLTFGPGSDREAELHQLARLPGVGPWTVQTVAMRALGDPDGFPTGDLGLRRAAISLGLPGPARQLEARAERWRPWRAYAVQYLWATTDHEVNRWPARDGPGQPARRSADGTAAPHSRPQTSTPSSDPPSSARPARNRPKGRPITKARPNSRTITKARPNSRPTKGER